MIMKDFIVPKLKYEERVEIFNKELSRCIDSNLSLIALIENPRARRYKWEVVSAYNMDLDDHIWRFKEGTKDAAMGAYLAAKEIQNTTGQPTIFISIKSEEEYELE